jgi:hypothetical protein
MCDYSLEMYGSRPAREFERYVTTRFPSGSIGLTSPGDCETAVCVRYQTKLTLENIPGDVQRCLDVGPVENATFVCLASRTYRDGVKFANGKCVSLKQLNTGVCVTVVSALDLSEERTKELALA